MAHIKYIINIQNSNNNNDCYGKSSIILEHYTKRCLKGKYIVHHTLQIKPIVKMVIMVDHRYQALLPELRSSVSAIKLPKK